MPGISKSGTRVFLLRCASGLMVLELTGSLSFTADGFAICTEMYACSEMVDGSGSGKPPTSVVSDDDDDEDEEEEEEEEEGGDEHEDEEEDDTGTVVAVYRSVTSVT